ncbi:MAG: right-handed parallel beta-helix repeat-containing protein [Phycisphaerales bacterium]
MRLFAHARVAFVALSFAAPAVAGDLNPPGPPAPTMKTLDEVEPRIPVGPLTTPGDADSVYKITQSGSYYLTGNVAGADRLSGVEIAASGVTLDLSGYELIGIVVGGRSQSGVRVTQAGAINVVIRNGSARGWGDDGVDASLADSCIVEQFVASQNGRSGVRALDRATIRNVSAVANSAEGVRVRGSAIVTGVVASDNLVAGVVVGGNAVVRECVATGSADGLVSEGVGSRFESCIASNNTGDGFIGADATAFINCTARDNGVDGFAGASEVRMQGCTAYRNGDDGASVTGNALVTGSAFNDNGSNGLESVNGGTTVLDCLAERNIFSGFGLVDGDNHIERCTVIDQGGSAAGIGVNGQRNLVFGNRVIGGTVGIRADGVPSTGTVVAANIVTGAATPFAVTASVDLGPVRITAGNADAMDNLAR